MSNVSVLAPGDRPGKNDCICGRGGLSNSHNVNFRAFIDRHRPLYLAATRTMKPRVSSYVVSLWRQTQNGRFLDKKLIEGPDGTVVARWYDVGDKCATRKVSQCLRARRKNHMFTGSLGSCKQWNGHTDSLINLVHHQQDADDSEGSVGSTSSSNSAFQVQQPKNEPTSRPKERPELSIDFIDWGDAKADENDLNQGGIEHSVDTLDSESGVARAENILAQMVPCAATITEDVFSCHERDEEEPNKRVVPLSSHPDWDEVELQCEFPSVDWAVFGTGEPVPLLLDTVCGAISQRED
ncbi:expressed unknown protein [Seminavis robusta]|uniref:DUF6824 domain-containing protein n=1 Tax=Seminavis robusta TaxID=568900 RepID=A0A9N8D8F0_9STRA|nr:expressed unknown protein [Seminavis robusta]|eukprot:Sro36_g022660.1 n/a (296) ;mRNA; r:7703-8827